MAECDALAGGTPQGIYTSASGYECHGPKQGRGEQEGLEATCPRTGGGLQLHMTLSS